MAGLDDRDRRRQALLSFRPATAEALESRHLEEFSPKAIADRKITLEAFGSQQRMCMSFCFSGMAAIWLVLYVLGLADPLCGSFWPGFKSQATTPFKASHGRA